MVTYAELFTEAMTYWNEYNKQYRILVPTYEHLIEAKRKLKIEPLRKINKADLRSYPKIELLEVRNEDQAEEYLLRLGEEELVEEILKVNQYLDSRIRRILMGRILDFRQQIRLNKCRKSPLLMDPDCSGRYKFRGYRISRRTLSDGDSGE